MFSKSGYLAYFMTFMRIFSVSEDDCQRSNELAGRTCPKRCHSGSVCSSPKKRCVCDGACGYSCVNENQRCKGLENKIPYGRVEFSASTSFNATAVYICDKGYMIEGLDVRICQGDGSWSGEPSRCVLKTLLVSRECNRPNKVDNAQYSGPYKATYSLGSMVRYSCYDGYKAQDGSVFTAWCVGAGNWVGPDLACLHVGCPDPPAIKYGKTDADLPAKPGTSASYSCVSGYTLVGPQHLTCDLSGKWLGDVPNCERIACKRPPRVLFATHTGLEIQKHYTLAARLLYTCEKGYIPHGHPRAICGQRGQWIGPTLTCTAKNCDFPGHIVNGWREGDYFTHPNRVTFHCNEGFRIVGRPHRMCRNTGVWSGSVPSCRAVVCPELRAPQQGAIFGTMFTFASVVRFKCWRGYQNAGSESRICQPDGTWSGKEAVCKVIDCGALPPLWNGYMDGHRTTVGSVFFFRCNPFTTPDIIQITTQCLNTGKWSHQPPNCRGMCQVPGIHNGTLIIGRQGEWVTHGTNISYRCKRGLSLETGSEVQCNNGTWNVFPKCAPVPCGAAPPSISNARRIFFGKRHGDRAKYACMPGYRMSGNQFVRCHYGAWLGGTPSCDAHYCPNPGDLESGKIYKRGKVGKFEFMPYIYTIRHGDRLEYKCMDGYRLNGPTGATCVNGAWSPPDKPICVVARHKEFKHRWHLHRVYTKRSPRGAVKVESETQTRDQHYNEIGAGL